MYGDLEGKSKPGLALELGKEIVQEWRSGFSIRPPPMSLDHKHWHGNERKYSDLSNDEIPVTESLEDTMERTLPLLQSKILPNLKQGKNVMIVAHGNSLRGIVKHIDGLTIEEIQKVGIPNGIPLLFKFDENMKPIRQSGAEGRLSGEFLEKKGLLRAALEKEEEFAKNVPGYELYNKSSLNLLFDSNSPFNESPTINPVLRGLQKLDQEKKLLDFALNNTTPDTAPILKLFTTESKDLMSDVLREGPILCIIRHGKTEHNKLGLFTGWEDATLAPEGRVEAREAGKLLKMHGIEFDVVYTSWLSRAIETAWLILNELDSLWLPIIKSWRLNERMYGKLTNMSKKMIGSTYGEEQLKKWRRSYETRPPKISSFSAEYPGYHYYYC
jgi:bisphosphoglycerate-dependent phosphoglycerate mutase